MMILNSLDMVHVGKQTNIGTLVVKITGQRRFAVRAWLGMALIKLGAAILPVGVDVDIAKD